MSNVKITEHEGIHFLWIDGKMWMWDLPVEVEMQEDLARQAFGKVLVAGHGLGIVQGFLTKNKEVENIETVEKHDEVRTAYFNHFNKLIPGHVIINDFYNLPDPSYQRWDCVIGDIWPEISEKYLDEYIRFRSHALFLTDGGRVLAWGQDYYEYLIQREGAKR